MMKHETVEPIAWDLNLASRMREAGVSLAKLAGIFGLSPDTVHCRLDPEFRAHRRKQVNDRRRYDSAVFAYRHYGDRVKEADIAARLAEAPEDDRNYTARNQAWAEIERNPPPFIINARKKQQQQAKAA